MSVDRAQDTRNTIPHQREGIFGSILLGLQHQFMRVPIVVSPTALRRSHSDPTPAYPVSSKALSAKNVGRNNSGNSYYLSIIIESYLPVPLSSYPFWPIRNPCDTIGFGRSVYHGLLTSVLSVSTQYLNEQFNFMAQF